MKLQKGGVASWFIFLVIIVVFGLMLTGGISVVKKNSSENQQPKSYLIQEDDINASGNKSLQLRKIGFTEVTTIADCGHGNVKGENEYYVLWATDPGPGQFAGQGGSIKAFYVDEWPITLGYGSVSPLTKSPDYIASPNIGDTSKKDANGFPYYPALFITDITDDPNNSSGDSQNGGQAFPPDEIYGTWKPLGTSKTKLSPNKLNLGQGADIVPMKSNLWDTINSKPADSPPDLKRTHWSSEIIWKVDNLKVNGQPLVNGRTYRVQIILHDGDFAGDIGQACTTIKY